MASLRVFVSHAHEDDTFCRAIVAALRDAGADVWYDEHNLGSGQLLNEIERELRTRPIFIVILSKAALLRSQWVKYETQWAWQLLLRDPSRLILPITAGLLNQADFDDWLFIETFKRVEDHGLKPFTTDEACRRTLRALALTPSGAALQPQETADDLIARGKALQAQGKHVEALPLFQHATVLAPRNFDAWANLGCTLIELQRWSEALPTCEIALSINPTDGAIWVNKGWTLYALTHYDEALVAWERALTIDPLDTYAWDGKGNALLHLGRFEGSLAAFNTGITIQEDPFLWSDKARTLRIMGQISEAEQAEARARQLEGK